MTGSRRNVGIDLLRIVSMCMIIVIHMNSYGKASEMIDVFFFQVFSLAGDCFLCCQFGEYLCDDQWFCQWKQDSSWQQYQEISEIMVPSFFLFCTSYVNFQNDVSDANR